MIYTLAKHQKLKPFANFIIILFYSNNVHETENIKDHPSIKKTHLLSNRPELAFHASKFITFTE
jgi:hypothetical protein